MSVKNQKKQKQESWLTYKRRLEKEMQEQYPNFKIINNVLGIFFVVSIFLTIAEIFIYDNTIINFYIPFSIWLITGLVVTPFFKKTLDIYFFNPYDPGHLPLVWQIFYNIVSWGGLAVFLFMSANYFFSIGDQYSTNAKILSYEYVADKRNDCNKAYVEIRFRDEQKELVFPCGIAVEKYTTVHLLMAKGFFGFDIIIDKSLDPANW